MAHHELEDDEHAVEELAASAEVFEEPVEEKKKRGLFRRRKSEPVAEDADAEPLEDESFENVTYWGSEVSEGEEPAEDTEEPVAETEPHESNTYVYGEDESQAADEAPAEPAEDDAAEEPAHEVVADSSEDEPAEDASATQRSRARRGRGRRVRGHRGRRLRGRAGRRRRGRLFEDERAPEAEHEPEPEPTLDDWHGADDAEDYEIDSAGDEVVAAPVPLKKKNGGGSRGKKVVGLKVGASQIAAAVVAGNGEDQTLVDVARRSLEEGVVVGGELRDHEALVRALKAFFKESRLPTKNVRLGLSSSRVGVRTFDIAGVEDDERFDNAVRFKAHEVLPVAAHESVLDYRVVEERYTESGEVSRRVLLVVAPRDQVEPYIEACREAGIRLAGIDLESFGLLRAFVPRSAHAAGPRTAQPSSSRSATSRPRSSSRAAGSASSPASSTGAEASSRTPSRTSSRCRTWRRRRS